MDCAGNVDERARADATSARLWHPPCAPSGPVGADVTSARLWRPPCTDRKAS